MRMPLSFLALAGLTGCSGGGTPSAPPAPTCQDPIATSAATRFSNGLLPVLQVTCGSATATCHGAVTVPNGHFSFATGGGRTDRNVYDDLVNVAPSNAPTGQGWMRVKPQDPAKSWIVEKLSSDQPGGLGYGARMPLQGQNLCQGSLDHLRSWIQNGAPFE
jgi:hypothetical protein